MSDPAAPPAPVRALDRGFVGTLVAAVAGLVLLYFLRPILPPFVAAGVLAFVFAPVADWLAARLHAPRIAGALAVFAALALLVGAFAYVAGPTIVAEIAHVAANLPALIAGAAQRIMGGRSMDVMGKTVNAQGIAAMAMQALSQLAQASRLLMLTASVAAAVFGFLLTWVLLFYFLADGRRIRNGLLGLLPPAHRETAGRLWSKVSPALRRYFVGVGAVVIYAWIASYVGLGVVLKLPHSVLLALLTGLLEMIPVAGPLVAAVIAGLAAVEHAKGLGSILAYIAYAIALRLSIDQMIGPVVLGRAARIHPTAVIFAFLAGGLLFGVSGVVLAVPVALSIKIVLTQIYERRLPETQCGGK